MCGFVIRKIEMLVMQLCNGGITNPTLLSVEPFLTVDYKSTGTVVFDRQYVRICNPQDRNACHAILTFQNIPNPFCLQWIQDSLTPV